MSLPQAIYAFVSHHLSPRQMLGGVSVLCCFVLPMFYSSIMGAFDVVTAFSWMSHSLLWSLAFFSGAFVGPIDRIINAQWVRKPDRDASPYDSSPKAVFHSVDSPERVLQLLRGVLDGAYLHFRQTFFIVCIVFYIVLPVSLGFLFFLIGSVESALGWLTLSICMAIFYILGIFTGPPYVFRHMPWTPEAMGEE